MMAGDMDWTASLGNAFLTQGRWCRTPSQRMRHLASTNGYLRTGGPIVVNDGPYITIDRPTPATWWFRTIIQRSSTTALETGLRRRSQLRLRSFGRHLLPALGLGWIALRLGESFGVHQQRRLGPPLDNRGPMFTPTPASNAAVDSPVDQWNALAWSAAT